MAKKNAKDVRPGDLIQCEHVVESVTIEADGRVIYRIHGSGHPIQFWHGEDVEVLPPKPTQPPLLPTNPGAPFRSPVI